MNNNSASNSRVARILAQISRYQVAMRWLWANAYRPFGLLSLRATILMFIALACRLGALGFLARYIHLLETNRTVQVLAYEIPDPRSSYVLLLVAASIALLLFLGSCISSYFSDITMLRLSALNEERCGKRAIAIFGTYGNHPGMAPWRLHYIRLVGGDARVCGVVARLALRSLQPMVFVLVTLAILVYLDWALTLELMLLALFAVPFIYRVNVRGATLSRAMEKQVSQAIVEKRNLIKSTAETVAAGKSPVPELEARYADGVLRTALDLYIGRLRVTVESALIMASLMAVAVFVILIQKGGHLMSATSGWTQLAAYLIILRLCMSNLTGLMHLAASVNRLYPQFARYVAFSMTAQEVEATGETAPAPTDLWRKPRKRKASPVEDLMEEEEQM